MVSRPLSGWQPVLQSQQADKAIGIARQVAFRLRERELLEKAIVATARQTAFPTSAHWRPYTIAQGEAGLAIACGYLQLCFIDERWDIVGHQFLEITAQAVERERRIPIGMFTGLSGLAFATWYLSQGGKRYHKLLAAVEEVLLPEAIELANTLSVQKKDIGVGQFDLISGLSGVGAYLLCRKDDAQAAEALLIVLRALIELTVEEAGLPRWYTPAYLLGDERQLPQYPYGNLNCGLAHGIPGPLGVLSLAKIAGINLAGMEDAIRRVATWLLQHRMHDQWGVSWPTAVRVESHGTVPRGSSRLVSPFQTSRTAWCYGSPGLARTLWFSGEALDDAEYRELAVAAMEAVYQRPLPIRRIDSPTFCHGVAGLMQITLRFAHDTHLPQFTEAAQALAEQLLSLYDPESLLGYYNLEPGDNHVDHPGILDGAFGVMLVLLAAATTIEPLWDRLFLLS